jgi:uncharacterized OsmC-like protein
MSEKNFETKLSLIDGYKFNVEFDIDCMPKIIVDETKPEGECLGPNPPRLLAVAVGHCMSSSLIYCLKKARIPVKTLETIVKTNLFRNENQRKRIGNIDIQIQLRINEEDKRRVNRCLTIFEDYCTVTQSIRKGIKVNIEVKS